MVKNQARRDFFIGISSNFAFFLFFFFHAFNTSICLAFLLQYALTCLSSLDLRFCMF